MEITKQVHALRQALLNWYPFEKGENALLCGTDVDVLEPLLSPHFKRVRAAGPAELADVLKCGAGEDERFDLIAAIDLVEITADVAALLKALSERLSENGTLLLGFRNRFGLKYLCGGLDTFMQTPFETIMPLSGQALPRYYGKEEMRQLLERAGFDAAPGALRWYYLMPDADFVQAVYTDDDLPKGSIRDRVFAFDPYHSPFIAAESQLYDDVVREGTLPHVANFYLVEARKAEHADSAETANHAGARRHVTYAALSTDRGEANGFATVLYCDGSAEKIALWPEGTQTLRRLYENIEALRARGILTVDQTFAGDRIRMPKVTEEASLNYLKRQLPDNPAAFLEVFSRIREDVLKSSDAGTLSEEEALKTWGVSAARLGPILKKTYIDMIPYNAFWTGEGLRYYDQEFTVENCPLRYVLYRALLYTWYHLPEMEGVLPLQEMKQKLGIEDLWDAFKAYEDRFVQGNRREKELAQLYEWRQISVKAIEARREALAREAAEERAEALSAENTDSHCDTLLQRVHAVQLRLLKEFDRVCRENGLQYFAVHGTLLGAVRHEGFIPWDDDIDVAMPREDYDRFATLAPKALKKGFFFQTPENDPTCFYGGYGKLRDDSSAAFEVQNEGHNCHQGIWIDVFPLDNVSGDAKQREKLQQKIRRVQRLLYAKSYKIRDNMLGDLSDEKISFYYLAKRVHHVQDLWKRLYKLCTSQSRSGLRSILACYYGEGAVNKTLVADEDLANVVELPFEDMKIYAPANYESWLKQRYGARYKALPSVEKRTRRKNVEFHPDIPYTAFKAAGSRYQRG